MEALLKKQNTGDLTTLTKQAKKGSITSQCKLSDQLNVKLREIIETSTQKQNRGDILQHLYFDVINVDKMKWSERVFFFMISSESMRHLLADEAQNHSRYYNTTIINHLTNIPDKDHLISINQALQELSKLNKKLVKTVEGVYFGNMIFSDIAFALNISTKQAKMNWLKARGWLYQNIDKKQCVI